MMTIKQLKKINPAIVILILLSACDDSQRSMEKPWYQDITSQKNIKKPPVNDLKSLNNKSGFQLLARAGFPPIDFNDGDCTANDLQGENRATLCPKELAALKLAFSNPGDYTIHDEFKNIEEQVESSTLSLRKNINGLDSTDQNRLQENIKSYYLKQLEPYNLYQEAEKDSGEVDHRKTCVYNKRTYKQKDVYLLCKEYRVIDKLRNMASNRLLRDEVYDLGQLKNEAEAYNQLADNMEARLIAYQTKAEAGLNALERNVLVENDMIVTPYLAVRGEPKDFLGLIQLSFQRLRDHVKEFVSLVNESNDIVIGGLETQQRKAELNRQQEKVENEMPIETNNRERIEKRQEQLLEQFHRVRNELSASINRLSTNYSHVVGPDFEEVLELSSETKTLGTGDLIRDAGSSRNVIDVKDNVTRMSIMVLNNVTIVANGVYHTHDQEVADLKTRRDQLSIELGKPECALVRPEPFCRANCMDVTYPGLACPKLIEELDGTNKALTAFENITTPENSAKHVRSKSTSLDGYVVNKSEGTGSSSSTNSGRTDSVAGGYGGLSLGRSWSKGSSTGTASNSGVNYTLGFYHDDAPYPNERLGMLVAECTDGGETGPFPIGTGAIIDVPENCTSIRLIINDDQTGIKKATCSWKRDNKCVSSDKPIAIKVVQYKETLGEFKKGMKLLEHKNLDKNFKDIAYSASPTIDMWSKIDQELKDLDVPDDFRPVFRPLVDNYVTIMLNQRQLDEIGQKMDLLQYDQQESNIKGQVMRAEIKALDALIEDTQVMADIQSLFDSYLGQMKQLYLDYIDFYARETGLWTEFYVKSIEYHYPLEKDRIKELKEKTLKLVEENMASRRLPPDKQGENICKSFESISKDFKDHCDIDNLDTAIEESKFVEYMEKFIHIQEVNNALRGILSLDQITHCDMDFGSEALQQRLGYKGSAPDIFFRIDDNGNPQRNIKFFIDKNDDRFNFETACRLLPQGDFNQCIQNRNLNGLEGYYEISFETDVNREGFANTNCYKNLQGIPKIVGVAFEWQGHGVHSPTPRVFLKKSPISWWIDENQKSWLAVTEIQPRDVLIHEAESLRGNDRCNNLDPNDVETSDCINIDNVFQPRDVLIHEAESLGNGSCRDLAPNDFETRDCINQVLGQSISSDNEKYQFTTNFLNERPGNEWTLLMPIGGGRDTSEIVEDIQVLKMHIYLKHKDI